LNEGAQPQKMLVNQKTAVSATVVRKGAQQYKPAEKLELTVRCATVLPKRRKGKRV